MMYLTTTIDSSQVPLIVGKFYEDGSVLAANPKREVFRVPRHLIRTPILHCSECGQPVLLKPGKGAHEDYPECPDNARHQYEKYLALSLDMKIYDRKSRRKAHKIAGQWLTKWRQQVLVEGRSFKE